LDGGDWGIGFFRHAAPRGEVIVDGVAWETRRRAVGACVSCGADSYPKAVPIAVCGGSVEIKGKPLSLAQVGVQPVDVAGSAALHLFRVVRAVGKVPQLEHAHER